MDDLIKLLQQLMSQKPRPKGGIADTAEGVEFLGKALSKEQQGNFMIVNSRLTDASRFEPFSIGKVGRDKRFTLISDYEQSLTGEFNKTVEFLKANPDIRLSKAQKDNIFYNLGVLRRISAEKNKLEKGIIEDGKKPSNVRDMEGNVLDPNEPIMGGTQVKESYKKDELMPIKRDRDYDDALLEQKAENFLKKNIKKEQEELDQISEIEELSQDLSNESNVDKILSKSKELKKSKAGKASIEGQMEKINKASNRIDELIKEREAMYKPKEEKAGKGQFTKAEYLIQRLRNTIKENPDDEYVQANFPNFIKELEANPDLAKNENVFKELGGDLPDNQKITVYDDDTLDFATLKPKKEKTPGEIVQQLIDEKFGKGYFDTVEKPTFKLNKEQFQKDFNVSDEEVEKILALSPEEQQKVLQEYIDKDFGQQIELSDFDVTDKEPNAQGGIVGLRI